MREAIHHGLRTLLFVMTPAAVGLFVLAAPIVQMLLEHGSFGPQSTWLTARALSFYAPGLMVFCLAKVFVPAFYALQDTRTPVKIGLCGVALNSR
jgi:putative peptidoglycan lipid II flippase